MDRRELKQEIIRSISNGDLDSLKKIKRRLNPSVHIIDSYYAIYKDGEYTGEAYDLLGNPLEVDMVEEVECESESDELPLISAIIITVSSKEAMFDCIKGQNH